MQSNKVGRRRALMVISTSTLAIGGLMGVTACDGGGDKKPAGGGDKKPTDKKPAAGGTGCQAAVDEKSAKMRKTLQYVDKTKDAEKKCDNCAQYEKGKFEKCGGCKLFAGPVQPEGYCVSWAAMPDAAPAPSGSASAG